MQQKQQYNTRWHPYTCPSKVVTNRERDYMSTENKFIHQFLTMQVLPNIWKSMILCSGRVAYGSRAPPGSRRPGCAAIAPLAGLYAGAPCQVTCPWRCLARTQTRAASRRPGTTAAPGSIQWERRVGRGVLDGVNVAGVLVRRMDKGYHCISILLWSFFLFNLFYFIYQ